MQSQQTILQFSDAERPIGDRMLKMAVETDRVEGYTGPHAVMVARLAEILGAQMGLHGSDLSAVKFAALAHDIGERVMKRNYLLHPNPLTWEETLDLWRHPILGEQAAGELRLPRQTQLLIRWHHEWWNGLGYPDGLAGEAIPIGARILRASDSYCALISDRPHRPGFEPAAAEQIIADLAGIEFDPLVVKLLLAILAEDKSEPAPVSQKFETEVETQVVLTPEGLQTALVPPEPESESIEIEAFSPETTSEFELSEPAAEVMALSEQEHPERINPEIIDSGEFESDQEAGPDLSDHNKSR
jgi:HD-GYP domain-containing protein (c-di-GMP phosphodiesterase class II)